MIPLRPNFATYGVLNLTPNSFSDGGRFSEVKVLKETLNEWKTWGVSVYDFGAESTAPSNDPISAEIEWERIEKLGLPLIPELPTGCVVSLDTYRPEIFRRFYRKVNSFREDLSTVFNDVSGVLDEELFSTLRECSQAGYVYSHTHVPERSQTSFHMEFLQEELTEDQFLERFCHHMLQAHATFSREKMAERVILDPCFGFSKTHEQNLTLLREMPRIWKKLLEQGISNDWLIGISKKSFLQRPQPEGIDSHSKMMSAEYLQLLHLWRLFTHWQKISGSQQNLYFRVHNPAIVYNMKSFLEFEAHATDS